MRLRIKRGHSPCAGVRLHLSGQMAILTFAVCLFGELAAVDPANAQIPPTTQTRKPPPKQGAPSHKPAPQDPRLNEPLEIKGLRLGISQTDVAEKVGVICKAGQSACRAEHHQVSQDFKYIAGFGSQTYIFVFENDQLVRLDISMYQDGFFSVVTGLNDKFGTMTSGSVHEITTRGGAQLENIFLYWKRHGQTLRIERFAGTIDTSVLILEDDDFVRREDEKRKEQRRKSL